MLPNQPVTSSNASACPRSSTGPLSTISPSTLNSVPAGHVEPRRPAARVGGARMLAQAAAAQPVGQRHETGPRAGGECDGLERAVVGVGLRDPGARAKGAGGGHGHLPRVAREQPLAVAVHAHRHGLGRGAGHQRAGGVAHRAQRPLPGLRGSGGGTRQPGAGHVHEGPLVHPAELHRHAARAVDGEAGGRRQLQRERHAVGEVVRGAGGQQGHDDSGVAGRRRGRAIEPSPPATTSRSGRLAIASSSFSMSNRSTSAPNERSRSAQSSGSQEREPALASRAMRIAAG